MTPDTDWTANFLTALADVGVVGRAAKLAGIHRSTAYRRRESDKDFAAKWDDAVEDSTDVLEGEAFRRAKDGTERPVYQAGELVGQVREYSDTLLIFLLKARRPQKYRDNARVVVAGDPANPVGPTEDLTKLSDAELNRRITELRQRHAEAHGREVGTNVFARIEELTKHFDADDRLAEFRRRYADAQELPEGDPR